MTQNSFILFVNKSITVMKSKWFCQLLFSTTCKIISCAKRVFHVISYRSSWLLGLAFDLGRLKKFKNTQCLSILISHTQIHRFLMYIGRHFDLVMSIVTSPVGGSVIHCWIYQLKVYRMIRQALIIYWSMYFDKKIFVRVYFGKNVFEKCNLNTLAWSNWACNIPSVTN